MNHIRQIQSVAVRGLAAAVPKEVSKNMDYDLLTDQEKKLLIKTIGVEERRIVGDSGITTADLCQASAEKLMDELGWSEDSVDLLVFVSQSPDYYLPASSIILQHRLGLPSSCMAFDVGLGCSGFVYGLSIVSSMIQSMGLGRALLLAGDVSSVTSNYQDKSTYPLFGDAGTACALEFDEKAEDMTFHMSSDGSGEEAIKIPHGGIKHRVSKSSFELSNYGQGINRTPLDLQLDGLKVFNFSITRVPTSLKELMAHVGANPQDVDGLIMHQANKLMNETIRRKLKVSREHTFYSITNYGNTSSASIPLTIVDQCRDALKQSKWRLLLAGFGVGLSWASAWVSFDHVHCSELIEL